MTAQERRMMLAREVAKSRRAVGLTAGKVARLCADDGASLRAISKAAHRATLAVGRLAGVAHMLATHEK